MRSSKQPIEVIQVVRRPPAIVSFAIMALISFSGATTAVGKICNIKSFLEKCPTQDPAYAQIRNDFVIRKDGVLVADIACQGPISEIPVAQLTDELVVLQTLRTIYYLDKGQHGHLPWTPESLYDWLKARVGGINIVSTGSDRCCDSSFGDGRSYFSVRAKDENNRNFLRSWPWLAEFIGLMMHERRHADPGGYPHTGCCDVGGQGCDQEYNEADLSPYGIQWWLRRQWIEGGLHTGYACLPVAELIEIRDFLRNAANQSRDRFCQNPPPELTNANNPLADCKPWACLADGCNTIPCLMPRLPLLLWRWLPPWVPVILLTLSVLAWRLSRRQAIEAGRRNR